MNGSDFAHALHEAVAEGRIGTPVCLRLIVRQPEVDAASVSAFAAEVAGRLFGAAPERIAARQSGDGRQWSVLTTFENGRTLFVTVVAATPPRVDALLFGNHGLARSEGAEALRDLTGDREPWAEWLRRSLEANGPVEA